MQAAVEIVAKHFSATGHDGACLVIQGKRIAIDVLVLTRTPGGKPRLRFDKGVFRLLQRMQAGLGDVVPDGKAVMFTVTAPIWKWSKTAAALGEQIKAGLVPGGPMAEIVDTIQGNRVRARLVDGGTQLGINVIGFVHNPDTDAAALMDVAGALVNHVEAEARRPAGPADERWLVLANEAGAPYLDLYRHVCAHLSVPGAFRKILAVVAGRVETLAG